MQRLRETFHRLRRRRRTALIPFVMGGDPDPSTTVKLLRALEGAGADVLEVGVPFSDPLADGPVIQRAAGRSLAGGTTPEQVLAIVQQAARRLTAPIVLLSYYNPIVRYRDRWNTAADPRPFLWAAHEAGISGIIVPDLPIEEGEPFRRAAHQAGVAPIFLAAPTSPAARLRQIARASEGFIYYVSLTGTTGARDRLSADWAHGVRQLKLITTKPVCVGFGVSTPAQAAAVARVADGVIVGSALIRRMEPLQGRPRAMVRSAARFVRQLRRGIDS